MYHIKITFSDLLKITFILNIAEMSTHKISLLLANDWCGTDVSCISSVHCFLQ